MHLAKDRADRSTPESLVLLVEMKRSAWWGSKGDWKTDLVHAYILRCLAVAYCKIGDFAKAVEESKFARERALEDLNDDGDCGLWRDSIVRESEELEQYCQSQTNEVGKELCALSDQYATLNLGYTAAHSETPTNEAEAMAEVQDSSMFERPESFADRSEELLREYAALPEENDDLASREEARAVIIVKGIPKHNNNKASEVYLVGTGDVGDWELSESLPIQSDGSGEWGVVTTLKKEHRYHGILVAIFDDGIRARYDIAEKLPLQSFVVNEGEKQAKLPGDLDPLDRYIVSLQWRS
ncbi:hypothetical protein JCM16303_003840 [Sporobolomyces ruberrimus]